MAPKPIMEAVDEMKSLLGYQKDEDIKVSSSVSGGKYYYVWVPKMNIRAQNKLHDCGWNILDMIPEGASIRLWIEHQ